MFISQGAQLTIPVSNEEKIQMGYSIDRLISDRNESISITIQELYTSVSSYFK